MEMLTLTQTQKLAKKITIVLYGSAYWKEIVNFDALVKYGMISPEDLELFQFADDPATAFELLKDGLEAYALQHDTPEVPAVAKSGEPAEAGGSVARACSRARWRRESNCGCSSRRTRSRSSRWWSAIARTCGNGCRGWTTRNRRRTCGDFIAQSARAICGGARAAVRHLDRGSGSGIAGLPSDRLAESQLQYRVLDRAALCRARGS